MKPVVGDSIRAFLQGRLSSCRSVDSVRRCLRVRLSFRVLPFYQVCSSFGDRGDHDAPI